MNLPDIITKGGEWFAKLGMAKSGGTRIVCVSGHVDEAGRLRAADGDPVPRPHLRRLRRHPERPHSSRALIPGGSSMPPLDASELDVPIEFDALMTDARIKDVEVKPGVPFDLGGGRKLKTMAGSGGVVVFDDSTDVVALCARIMEFYAHESCGQCTPCREGSGWLARVCKRLARRRGRAGRRRAAGQHRQRHRAATRSARWATRRPGRCWGSSPSSAPTSRPSWRKAEGRAGSAEGRRQRQPVTATRSNTARRASREQFVVLAAGRLGRRSSRCSPSRGATRSPRSCRWWRRSSAWPAIYATLYAHFLAVLQVLVYAGAIMVLFIFVVMILNREEVAPLSLRPMRLARASRPPSTCWRVRRRASASARRRGGAAGRRRDVRHRRRRSATSCSASSSTRSRRSRCCCWSRSSAASSCRARTRKRSPRSAPPTTASRSHELASQRLPGATPARRRRRQPRGGTTDAMPTPTTWSCRSSCS